VERTIRYLRASFWPAIQWDDLEDLNRQAARWSSEVAAARKCPGDDTRLVRQAWGDEKCRLLDFPDDHFPTHDRKEVKVGKQPYARFDGNDYSLPHEHVRRRVTVWATPEVVRLAIGDRVVAEHMRSFDKGAQIEDPDHITALVKAKREGRVGRGQDRLHHAVPRSAELLEGAARRGHNLGSAVAALLRLLDTWGAQAVRAAVDEALAADALHVAAVRQVLERRAQQAGAPPPVAVSLPDDPRVRQLHVTPHSLNTYDAIDGGPDA
jgi:hypothetical protein